MSAQLVLLAALLASLSGLPALFAPRSRHRALARASDRAAALLAVVASGVGLAALALFLAGRGGGPLALSWEGLPGARLDAAVDGLSALFLLPLFVVSGAGAIYATAYWAPARHPRTAPTLRLFYGLTTGAIAVVLVARNALLFLAAWEVMALGAFVLVITEGHRREVRAAGWLYLVATHAGMLALLALFTQLARLHGGSFALAPLPPGIAGTAAGGAVFGLALLGFGVKAGILPLHVWLPSAHAAAPSHVSALMSGVLLKTGIYGLVRVLTLFPDPPLSWGLALLAVGAASGVLGVAFALGQHDLKRLLAYHSIENIGIIVMGLGLGLAGEALHQPSLAVLGFGGGLLHVVNHALFKGLLFLGAGSVLHATGTRDMDRMGGLLRRLPRTGATFLVGAVAICGLPPGNGFVSEWLLYLGFLRWTAGNGGGPLALAAAGAATALALIGGLALTCFVKAFGAVFLGLPRGREARGHETRAMTLPMTALAFLCLAIGLAPIAVAPLVDAALSAVGTAASIGTTAPLATLGAAQMAIFAGIAALVLTATALFPRVRRAKGFAPGADEIGKIGTWDCGYAAPTPRMQYTASSFASVSVGFFRWALLPQESTPRLERPFPLAAHFHSAVPDAFLDRLLLPAFRGGAWLLSRARALQSGHIQLYLLYLVLVLLLLLSQV
jgi:hydrogenase-4 component B